jgi:D-sedoheptulose 7-phosphate isomerase
VDSQQIITKHIIEHQDIVARLDNVIRDEIALFAKTISHALSNGSTLFWCGNGGSAADSQHLAAELVGRFKNDRRPLRSIALTTDTSVLTCVANDYSYEDVFSRQVEALARPGDVILGISTSGHSENILRALRSAKVLSVITLCLLGKNGGTARAMADHAIVIPSESTARIQEAHILIGHILCDLIEQEMGLA